MPNTLRTDFHDDAFWKPRLTTDKAGRLTFEVTYPDDITSWDANFIVVGGRRQADRKQLRIKSYKPLNAQLSVPRFAIAGDSLNAAGRLTNHTGDTLSVRRTIETDGRTAEKQIRIATSHTDAIPAVAGDADSIRIVYSLTTPGGYFDGERRAIPIYKAGILETHGEFAVLNDTAALRFTPDPALGTVTIHAEASAMQAFLDEIENIDLYPHLCNEQMASKVKALLSKNGYTPCSDGNSRTTTRSRTCSANWQPTRTTASYGDGGTGNRPSCGSRSRSWRHFSTPKRRVIRPASTGRH